MSDDPTQPAAEPATDPAPAPEAAPTWSPPSREEWEAALAASKRVAELEAAATAAADAARVKNGEAATLLEERTAELAAARAEIDGYRAAEEKRLKALADRNKTRVEAIPDSLRGLVPTGYDAPALAEWLDSNADALQVAGARPGGTGPRGGSVDYPAAMVAEARHHGYTTPEQLARYHAGPWQRSTNPHRNTEA